MGRRILAVIVAFIVANAIFLIVTMIATIFAPFAPKNLEYMTLQERASYFGSMPMGAYLTEIFGYILGSIAAGWIVSRISKDRYSIVLPLIVDFLLTLGALIAMFSTVPGQPLWVVVIILVVLIPVTVIGQRFART